MRARAYMRNHQVDMDEPGDLTATDVAASAHEQLLSAIGSCMTVGFVVNATKQGVRIHDLEIAVEGYFDNIRKWAGVEDEGNPGYGPRLRQVLRPRRRRRGHPEGNLAARCGRLPRHPVGGQPHLGGNRLRDGGLMATIVSADWVEEHILRQAQDERDRKYLIIDPRSAMRYLMGHPARRGQRTLQETARPRRTPRPARAVGRRLRQRRPGR